MSMLPGDGDENEEENDLYTQVIIDDIPAPFHSRRKMSFTSVRTVHGFLKRKLSMYTYIAIHTYFPTVPFIL